ncbi:3-dehydroquinate synthase [bacterium]|nr:MAG: 3-dehydroquinate synthase [bacterium]
MRKIKVNLGERSYDIIIGSGILSKVGSYIASLNMGSHAYVITNKLISKKYAHLVCKSLEKNGISCKINNIKGNEGSKSLSVAGKVLNDLTRYGVGKKIFIVALGGGVVGDLAGFVASFYKRGVAYVQIPTTLLAQVDSSIGGKTAIDLPQAKNIIGSFYQPKLVFADTAVLKTLPKRQLQNGLAEVIKYAAIKDKALFLYLLKNYAKALSYNSAVLNFIIYRCAKIKAQIVSKDEKETKGLRTILNFGHTIGHAIEAAGKYKKYSHGQAVALGMIVAADISRRLALLKDGQYSELCSLIKKTGLPAKAKGVSFNNIMRLYLHDKKFIGSKNRFVLLKSIGNALVLSDIPPGIINSSIKQIF